MKFPTTSNQLLELQTRTTLEDYVTAIAWSSDGQIVASDAAGGVTLWDGETLVPLQTNSGTSVDCLAFSHDGQFLATGGQDGRVRIRRWRDRQLIATLENAPAWVDKLAWNPKNNQLAFSLGRYVQVWDANTEEIVVTLNFENSSVLGIDWHPDGQNLAIAGYQGAKVWDATDWDDDPYIIDIPSASLAIAWSPDGKYIASGNMDRTITVLEWGNPHPWVMRGFPGKIRHLAWSSIKLQQDAPLLASASVEGIVVWEKLEDENLGWDSRLLQRHTDVVQAIAFQPGSLLLASAAADGWLYLWQKAKRVAQIIDDATDGLSCLAWHPQGQKLAAGSQTGELLLWSKASRGTGFSRGK